MPSDERAAFERAIAECEGRTYANERDYQRDLFRAGAEWMGEAVEELDLLEFVNEATRCRPEAQADLRAALTVGAPMACAAVELYRAAIRALTAREGESHG